MSHLQVTCHYRQAQLGNSGPEGCTDVDLQYILLGAESVWSLQEQHHLSDELTQLNKL